MRKIIIPTIAITLSIVFLIVFFTPTTDKNTKTYPDCYQDNLDKTDADWCKENMFDKVEIDLLNN